MSKILVQYEADVSAFKAQLKGVTEDMKTVENTGVTGAKNLDKAFEKTAGKAQTLKSQLRELKEQLANATDPKEIERLARAAGELSDKIDDASDAARIFASESKFEQIGNAVGSLGSKLRNLDFKGAADQSKLLLATTKSLTFKEAVGGIKDLGTTLLNVGKSLLLNPIFLLGTAITLIIANFDKLKSSGGLVGKVFSSIGNIIKLVIDSFTALSDAIGLTDTKSAAVADSIIASYSRIKDATTKRYESEIAAAKRSGQETELIEIKKLSEFTKANDKIIEQLRLREKAQKELGLGLSDEEKTRLNELVEENRKTNIQILDLYAASKNKQKEVDKKKQEDYKKNLDEIAALDKVLRDLRTNNIVDEEEKKIKIIENAFNDEVEKYKGNAAIIIELETKKERDIQAVRDERIEKEREEYQKRLAAQEVFNKARLELATASEKEIDENVSNIINQSFEKNTQNYLEYYINAKKEAEKVYTQLLIDSLGQLNNIFQQNQQNRIDTINENAEKEIEAQQNNYERGIISKEEFEKRKNKIEEESKKKENEIKRKAFLVDQNIAVLQAIMNTAVAVTAALKQPFPLNVALVATATAKGALEVALIKSQQPPKFAKGVVGLKGKGTRTSDEIPALLSVDESVITADGTEKHRGLLTAINKGKGAEYLNNIYIAPALRKQKEKFEKEKESIFANNLIKSILLNQNQFKDENIVNGLRLIRKEEKENTQMLITALNGKNNKHRY